MTLGNLARAAYEAFLERRLSDIPRHVAVIQDGNRRYARSRGDDPTEGHADGAETTENLLDWAYEIGVEEVTVYAFSTENFERDDDELERLFDVIADKLHELADGDRVHDREVQVCGVGDIDRLPDRVREAVERVEEVTADYTCNRLNVALAYGGRDELLRAARSVARDVDRGVLSAGEVDAGVVGDRLEVVSDVDLVVRTGGERRTSNFLPWQARGAGAQVYFSDAYWPEFDRTEFLTALAEYNGVGDDTRASRLPERADDGEPAD